METYSIKYSTISNICTNTEKAHKRGKVGGDTMVLCKNTRTQKPNKYKNMSM